MSSICRKKTCGECLILFLRHSTGARTYYPDRPEEFVIETGKKEAKETATSTQHAENEDSDDDLGEYVNPNRIGVQDSSDDEDDDDEDEDDEDDQQSGEEEGEEENEQIEGEENEGDN